MRLIVNERQYKQLLIKQREEIDNISEWVDYIIDFTINNLENKYLFESILSANKLNVKLNKFSFFKKLPIENFILNVYNSDEFNSDFESDKMYINEENRLENIVINIDINPNTPLIEQLDKNKLKITLSNINDFYKNGLTLIKESNGTPWESDMSGKPLKVGENNNKDDVTRIQKMLVLLNYDIGGPKDNPNINGIYDQKTADAVKKYQEDAFLYPENWTSIIDKVTYNALYRDVEDLYEDYDYDSFEEFLELGIFDGDVVENPVDKEKFLSSDEEIADNIETTDDEETADNIETTDDFEVGGGSLETALVDINHEDLIKLNANSSPFGMRNAIKSLCDQGYKRYCKRHMHAGQDYAYPKGTKVILFKPGIVTQKGCECLKIEHNDGSSRYCHLDKKKVNKGDKIEIGTFIGTVGGKGYTKDRKGNKCHDKYGAHLHLEYEENGKKVNPIKFAEEYLRFLDKNTDYKKIKKK